MCKVDKESIVSDGFMSTWPKPRHTWEEEILFEKKKMPPKGGPVDYSMWDLLINDDYGTDL